jgi:predicted enzyme related to lactoylglutathione lyase
MDAWLEHCNLTVSDLDGALDFFLKVFPEFKLRKKGNLVDEMPDGQTMTTPWAHVGTEISYLALQGPPHGMSFQPPVNTYFNHMGFVVEDIEQTLTRVKSAGYERVRVDYTHPHRKRAYAWVFDDNVLEFVEYSSERPEERNDYDS